MSMKLNLIQEATRALKLAPPDVSPDRTLNRFLSPRESSDFVPGSPISLISDANGSVTLLCQGLAPLLFTGHRALIVSFLYKNQQETFTATQIIEGASLVGKTTMDIRWAIRGINKTISKRTKGRIDLLISHKTVPGSGKGENSYQWGL